MPDIIYYLVFKSCFCEIADTTCCTSRPQNSFMTQQLPVDYNVEEISLRKRNTKKFSRDMINNEQCNKQRGRGRNQWWGIRITNNNITFLGIYLSIFYTCHLQSWQPMHLFKIYIVNRANILRTPCICLKVTASDLMPWLSLFPL